MFCLFWRLVKSRNLWIAMSLPVSTVCTIISAGAFYIKISKPLVAYALGSVYLLCARTRGWCSYQSCLENPAPGFAKGWQKALAFTFVRHSVGELGCQRGSVPCLVRLPTGLNICERQTTYRVKYLWADMNTQRCIWGFRFGAPRTIQTTQLWRNLRSWQLSILVFDMDLFLWSSCHG